MATGTMDCTADRTWWVEVPHTGRTSKRLPKGMFLGHVSAYFGTVAAISLAEWAALGPSLATAPDATDQGRRNNDSDKAPFCKQRHPSRSNILSSSVFPRRA